jgi:hypothetical protein
VPCARSPSSGSRMASAATGRFATSARPGCASSWRIPAVASASRTAPASSSPRFVREFVELMVN